MLRESRIFVPAAVMMLLGSMMMVPVPAQDQQEASAVEPTAGLIRYKGGPSKAKYAITQTSPTRFGETNTWVNLPNAVIPNISVPTTPTDGDLFNVAFSAECRLVNGAPDDWLRIRILDNGVPMEPYDGQQAFCSADSYATHKGNWVKRVRPGNHTLVVQFWILDNAPAEILGALIDDWTFEVVVYE
jgi:hypothetical protein